MHNNKYKILVIEDEDNINNLLKNLLETSGYQVIPAKSCTSGQMLYASHRPDLVILDLGLPDFDGMTFFPNGSTVLLFFNISKCRCGPVERPVLPT